MLGKYSQYTYTFIWVVSCMWTSGNSTRITPFHHSTHLVPSHSLPYTSHDSFHYTLVDALVAPMSIHHKPMPNSPGTQTITHAPPLRTSLGNWPETLRNCWAGVKKTKQSLPKLLSWEHLWKKEGSFTKNCRRSTNVVLCNISILSACNATNWNAYRLP